MGGNHAIATNSGVFRNANLAITNRGSDWYFTVMAIMGVSTLAALATGFKRSRSSRIFHYISAGLLATATISYFSMGAGLGQDPITVEFQRGGKVRAAGTREIFYVRYIDWFVTTPLLLLDLLLTSGMPFPTILSIIFADLIMIVCGLVGALTSTRYKWGYFVFGCAAFFYVVWGLLFEGRRHASALGGSIKRTYNMCGVLTIFVWFLYPIAWGVSEGGNVIHPDSEAVFYGILDLIAKPVFTALLLWGHRSIDPRDLGLHYNDGALGDSSRHHREKHPIAADGTHDGTHNGVSTGVNDGVNVGSHNGVHNGTGTNNPTNVV